MEPKDSTSAAGLRILFVDDDPRLLAGIRRSFHSLRKRWTFAFAESAYEALDILSSSEWDVIITDMRMPGMDGAELLEKVRRSHPTMIRMILSGYSEHETLFRGMSSSHYFLPKPCSKEELLQAIKKAFRLRFALDDKKLMTLVTGLKTIPSLPSIHTTLMQEVNSKHASMQRLGEIISTDIGMSTKILQLVNSAFFGLPRTISDPAMAAKLLGMDIILSLAMGLQIFTSCPAELSQSFDMDAVWFHSLRTAKLAKAIMQLEGGNEEDLRVAFVAGLLHECGRIILATNLPRDYMKVQAHCQLGLSVHEAESEIFGVANPEVGAYLLALWGLPNSIVEVVAFHCRPPHDLQPTFSPLAAVHVANALAREDAKDQDSQLDLSYLESLSCKDRIARWKLIAENQYEETVS
jgi:HD-like signal output (HDOD) protein/CheY-like chemotaxis protein